MAKGKDIAGLAALGTLAYMMGRKQGAAPSTSPEANKPPVTTVTPAAVAPPKPVEDDRYLERDIGKERSAMQRLASVAAAPAPAPVSAPAPAAQAPSGDVTKPISTRPGTMGAYVPRRAPAPMAGSGRGGQGGAREGEAEAYRQKQFENAQANANTPEAKASRQKQIEDQAVENVYPEQMIGGPGLSAIRSAAKTLATRGRASASPYLKELAAPTRQLPYDKAGAVGRTRDARAAGRQEEMLRENARRSGLDPDNINPVTTKMVRDRMGGDEFTLSNKRGGAIRGYANGGSVSSRADGIAQRGKTNCKIC